MMLSRILWASTLILGLSAATTQAQSLRNNDGPAEYPPSSFKGKQYVDSKGCVYIRAGVGGQVTWVPRVARNRQVVCGYKPTLASSSQGVSPNKAQQKVVVIEAAEPVAPPTPAAKPAPKPLFSGFKPQVAQAPKPAPKPVVRKVAPAKPVVTAARPAPERKVMRKPAPLVVPKATAPRQVVRAAPIAPVAPQKRVDQRARAGTIACPNLSVVGREYTRVSKDREVRCGPQADHPQTAIRGYGASGGRLAPGTIVKPGDAVPPGTRVVPRHVYEQNQAAKVTTKVPKGYRAAFKDDRLNTRRAEGTMTGKARMELVWTNTVPRRLVDRKTRRDVTALYPNIKAPAPVISTRGTQKPKAVAKAQAKPGKRQVTVSTRSAPRAAPAGHRYVQVGTFGVPANATGAIKRLQAAGLPVRIGKYKKGGKDLKIVLSGPFADAKSLSRALSMAKRAGFRDAFTRK